MPVDLQDLSNIVKMLTLLFPCTVRRPIPNLETFVDRIILSSVFRENNHRMRLKFFSDPLVKYLWSNFFIRDSPEIIVAHLRRIRSQDIGEAKQERILMDMKLLEIKLNFKTLPDNARDYKNL